jgi:hypothetical protein
LAQITHPHFAANQELSIICLQLFITLLRRACGLEGELLLERERTIAVREGSENFKFQLSKR